MPKNAIQLTRQLHDTYRHRIQSMDAKVARGNVEGPWGAPALPGSPPSCQQTYCPQL